MTNLMEPETSKKNHGIPVDHLDFKYVEQCSDVKELEKIYRVLESGVEGKYTDLEKFVFDKIKKLSPNSRILRKDLPIASKDAMAKDERVQIDNEIEDFFKNISDVEKKLVLEPTKSKDENLPPIRSKAQLVLNGGDKKPATSAPATTKAQPAKAKSAKPRDYREWEKIEKELEKAAEVEEEEQPKPKAQPAKDDSIMADLSAKSKALLKNLQKEIIAEDLPESVRTLKADQEKCKGNEAFNAGNYEEALIYYTRSLKYLPNAACYNNRALTYLKMEKWERTIDDCNSVLEHEPENVKALLRRASAYLKKKRYAEAGKDIDKCLRLEPGNKKAQELKADIEKAQAEKERIQSKGGNRIAIEETDGSEDDDDEEKNEVKAKPVQVSKQRSIPIAEVETDEDEEHEEVKPTTEAPNACPPVQQKAEAPNACPPVQQKAEAPNACPPVQQKAEAPNACPPVQQKAEPVPEAPRQFELPKKVIELKDKAFKLNASGQYGEAIEAYSKAIAALSEALAKAKSDEPLAKFYENNLSVLHNNKASGEYSTCDYKACIRDCDLGLASAEPNAELRLKLLWKKAQSLEMLEKYDQAFLIFEQIMRSNPNFKNVQQSYNRIKRVLSESGQLKSLRRDAEPKPEPEVAQSVDISKQYDELKSKGNELIKVNKIAEACELYTRCIELDQANITGYLNRSLCFVKLNKPDLAIQDATRVLERDASNVKALFRRANAYRLKENYELAMGDLEKLLTIEPHNKIAITELEEVKKARLVKQEPAKVLITEPAQPTPVVKTKVEIPTVKIEKKPADFSKVTNAYEFLQAWNSITPKDLSSYAHLIASVDPANLPKFIGSKLDDDMLSKLVKCLHMLVFDAECSKHLSSSSRSVADYLKTLTLTQRFNVVKLFINQELKSLLKNLFDSKELAGHKDLPAIVKAYDL